MASAMMGAMCCWKLTANPLFISRLRWIASDGMRMTGRLILSSSCVTVPSRFLTTTRPATPRSRSNHVYHSPPP